MWPDFWIIFYYLEKQLLGQTMPQQVKLSGEILPNLVSLNLTKQENILFFVCTEPIGDQLYTVVFSDKRKS